MCSVSLTTELFRAGPGSVVNPALRSVSLTTELFRAGPGSVVNPALPVDQTKPAD